MMEPKRGEASRQRLRNPERKVSGKNTTSAELPRRPWNASSVLSLLRGDRTPEKASEFLVCLRLCLRWAMDYACPRFHHCGPRTDLYRTNGLSGMQ